VINHAGGVSAGDYSKEGYTKLYLGFDYALLRKPFLEAAKKERSIDSFKNVFICFGGSDIYNLTLKTLEICKKTDWIKKIYVVVGAAYHHKGPLEAAMKGSSKEIKLMENLSAGEMIAVLNDCQLAVAPASSILFELCCVKMPVISGYYIE